MQSNANHVHSICSYVESRVSSQEFHCILQLCMVVTVPLDPTSESSRMPDPKSGDTQQQAQQTTESSMAKYEADHRTSQNRHSPVDPARSCPERCWSDIQTSEQQADRPPVRSMTRCPSTEKGQAMFLSQQCRACSSRPCPSRELPGN